MRRVYMNNNKSQSLRNKVTQEMRDMRAELRNNFPKLMARIQTLLSRAEPPKDNAPVHKNTVRLDKKKNLNTVLSFLENSDISPDMKREIEKSLRAVKS